MKSRVHTRRVKNDKSSESIVPQVNEAIIHAVGQSDQRRILPYLEERLEFNIPSDTSYLHAVLSYLLNRLAGFGIIEPNDSNTFVALDEAIANAILHGNKNDISKKVRIVAELNCHLSRFTITDEGAGFNHEQVPDPTHPENLLRSGGRGLLLIKHLMDEVSYNEKGNELTMVKYAAENCPSEGGGENP